MTQTEYEGRLFIDGEFREARSGRRYNVINPADESVVGTAADAGAEDVHDAITAARRAADETDWGTDHKFRRHCLEQLQEGLRREIDTFRKLVTAEAGVCAAVIPSHVDAMIDGMDFFNNLITEFQWEEDLPPYDFLGFTSNRRIRYEPYGVVGAITPWNAPFMTAIWKVHHGLATGNTVVLKSAPDTPLTAAMLAKVAAEQTDLPPGVLNTISSEDKAAAGDAMTADPRIDLYHFTGSPGVGQRIMERAADGIRHVVLELGGKSANVLLPDADLDTACGLGVAMCMNSSGQGCALATRMVVHASIYDEVLQRLEAIVGNLPWGDPTDPTNMVGPIIRLEQLERIEGLVDRARAAGARVLCGGKRGDRGGKGFWYEPTVVADVDENAEIAQTEVFGPVLAVIKYDGDDDEAVRVANNTRYGLSGYVQSRDEERAWRVAHKLRAGTVNINDSFYLSPDAPFGGWGISGVGVEHGVAGFRDYLRIKSIASPYKG
ncbi:aldehyde dehydrogenase family protein [Mycolicibacterium hassiacum DSM 44199]|jgi:aldehyde dehydrogenase (NAD+)|uniref:Aldehyde dehydrogenase family protein n=1 Tax=Mycolicibacterium hassiacum (strain DSM 44199 / CIP 105218 / JCM 12690 / 3849) TaxID=1122247 RepID=K5BJ59_MYCHD|nr:aldehyde dehydrogenase family protein [Mycolicibacterium hassiacum]EKF22544.1 aldehyde dehydrogenase family protein [Mycolicibacterium hassiacum DSM 44199]MBX5486299.1 aldehyde dehydrogenase family protein [Mycolicibacterium hassiacum]MDA4088724.1 aldehyde dehydrogenase [Mycolicibacterium hassiacum DSM 44199]PZN20216.1 MAG: aldehyde dehydrogenase [Mycolicibacterium hassiacum]VCT91454.1 3-succinoylsemialdehyde-pyridine dehydrogenase [Mycolicibacterium hassiacum DSM 44199]